MWRSQPEVSAGSALGEGLVNAGGDDSVYPDGHTSRWELVRFGDSRLSAMEFAGGQDPPQSGGQLCGEISSADGPRDGQNEGGWSSHPLWSFQHPFPRTRDVGARVLASPAMGAGLLVAVKGTVEPLVDLTSGWTSVASL